MRYFTTIARFHLISLCFLALVMPAGPSAGNEVCRSLLGQVGLGTQAYRRTRLTEAALAAFQEEISTMLSPHSPRRLRRLQGGLPGMVQILTGEEFARRCGWLTSAAYSPFRRKIYLRPGARGNALALASLIHEYQHEVDAQGRSLILDLLFPSFSHPRVLVSETAAYHTEFHFLNRIVDRLGSIEELVRETARDAGLSPFLVESAVTYHLKGTAEAFRELEKSPELAGLDPHEQAKKMTDSIMKLGDLFDLEWKTFFPYAGRPAREYVAKRLEAYGSTVAIQRLYALQMHMLRAAMLVGTVAAIYYLSGDGNTAVSSPD